MMLSSIAAGPMLFPADELLLLSMQHQHHQQQLRHALSAVPGFSVPGAASDHLFREPQPPSQIPQVRQQRFGAAPRGARAALLCAPAVIREADPAELPPPLGFDLGSLLRDEQRALRVFSSGQPQQQHQQQLLLHGSAAQLATAATAFLPIGLDFIGRDELFLQGRYNDEASGTAPLTSAWAPTIGNPCAGAPLCRPWTLAVQPPMPLQYDTSGWGPPAAAAAATGYGCRSRSEESDATVSDKPLAPTGRAAAQQVLPPTGQQPVGAVRPAGAAHCDSSSRRGLPQQQLQQLRRQQQTVVVEEEVDEDEDRGDEEKDEQAEGEGLDRAVDGGARRRHHPVVPRRPPPPPLHVRRPQASLQQLAAVAAAVDTAAAQDFAGFVQQQQHQANNISLQQQQDPQRRITADPLGPYGWPSLQQLGALREELLQRLLGASERHQQRQRQLLQQLQQLQQLENLEQLEELERLQQLQQLQRFEQLQQMQQMQQLQHIQAMLHQPSPQRLRPPAPLQSPLKAAAVRPLMPPAPPPPPHHKVPGCCGSGPRRGAPSPPHPQTHLMGQQRFVAARQEGARALGVTSFVGLEGAEDEADEGEEQQEGEDRDRDESKEGAQKEKEGRRQRPLERGLPRHYEVPGSGRASPRPPTSRERQLREMPVQTDPLDPLAAAGAAAAADREGPSQLQSAASVRPRASPLLPSASSSLPLPIQNTPRSSAAADAAAAARSDVDDELAAGTAAAVCGLAATAATEAVEGAAPHPGPPSPFRVPGAGSPSSAAVVFATKPLRARGAAAAAADAERGTPSGPTVVAPNAASARPQRAAAAAAQAVWRRSELELPMAPPHAASAADVALNSASAAAAAVPPRSSTPQVFIAKAMTASDARTRRLILPRGTVETRMPELLVHGGQLSHDFHVTDTAGRAWQFVLRAWQNGANPKPVYVLEHISEFVKAYGVKAGDVMGLLHLPDGSVRVEVNTPAVIAATATGLPLGTTAGPPVNGRSRLGPIAQALFGKAARPQRAAVQQQPAGASELLQQRLDEEAGKGDGDGGEDSHIGGGGSGRTGGVQRGRVSRQRARAASPGLGPDEPAAQQKAEEEEEEERERESTAAAAAKVEAEADLVAEPNVAEEEAAGGEMELQPNCGAKPARKRLEVETAPNALPSGPMAKRTRWGCRNVG